MTLDEARKHMRDLAADLDALRPHLNSTGAAAVDVAWDEARTRFLKAVEIYTLLLKKQPEDLVK